MKKNRLFYIKPKKVKNNDKSIKNVNNLNTYNVRNINLSKFPIRKKSPSKLANWASQSDDIFTIFRKFSKKSLVRKYFKAWLFVLLIIAIITTVSAIFISRINHVKKYNLPNTSQGLNVHFVNHSNSLIKLAYVNNKTHYLTKFNITGSEYNKTRSEIASGGELSFDFVNYMPTIYTPNIIKYNLNNIPQLQKSIPKNAEIMIDFEQENAVYQTTNRNQQGLIITFSEIINTKSSTSLFSNPKISASKTIWTVTDYYYLEFRKKNDRILFNSKVMDSYKLPKQNSDERVFSHKGNTYAVTKVNYNFLKYDFRNRKVKYTNPDLSNNTVKIDATNLIISEDTINSSNANFINFVENQSITNYNLAKNTIILNNFNDHTKNPPYALNLKVEITTIPQNNHYSKKKLNDENKYYLSYSFNLANIIALPFNKNYDTYYFFFQAFANYSWFKGLSFGLDFSIIEGKTGTSQYKVLNADFNHTD